MINCCGRGFVGTERSRTGLVRFAVYEVNLQSGELRKRGIRLRLPEQPFQVLAALLERPGEIVTREELVRLLWSDGTVVDYEGGLNAAVTRLRQTLSDSAETPRYVEPLPVEATAGLGRSSGWKILSLTPIRRLRAHRPPRRASRITWRWCLRS